MRSLSLRQRLKDDLILSVSSLIELMLFLPCLILYKVYLLPASVAPQWMILLPLLSLTGVLLRYRCDIRWKQLGVAMLLGLAAGMLSGGMTWSAIPLTVAGFICAYLGMTAESRLGRNTTYYAGIGIYFVVAIVFGRIPQLQSSMSLLTWSGSLSVIIVLLLSNSDHLRYTSLSGRTSSLPPGLRLHNRISVLLVIVLAVVLAAGAGKMMGALFLGAIRQLLLGLSRLFSGSDPTPLEPKEPQPAMPVMPPAEANEPGLLAMIMNIASYVVVAAVIGIALFYTGRWLYRNTGGLVHKAIAKLLSILMRRQPVQENNAYLDEEKSIFNWEKTMRNFKQFWSSGVGRSNKRDRWENMQGNGERVRWLYRQWLRSKLEGGYEIKNHLTPQETGADVAAWTGSKDRKRKEGKVGGGEHMPEGILLSLYDQARYSDAEPTDAELAKVTIFKKMKS